MPRAWTRASRVGITALAVAGITYACTNDYGDIGLGTTSTATSSSSSSSASSGASGGAGNAGGGGNGGAGQGPGGGGTAGMGSGGCGSSMEDCDDDGSCETDTSSDVANCGACDHACDGAHTSAIACVQGKCAPTCDANHADCDTPDSGDPDDGCETNIDNGESNCGGCDNQCFGNLVCTGGLCGCDTSNDCGTDGVCVADICQCPMNDPTPQCQPGEVCTMANGCSCNGNVGCSLGFVCCDTPPGCKDVLVDEQNCGACGKVCPQGDTCVAGLCQ